jgi:hypothetical protein
MPVRKVPRGTGKTGYQYGRTGKVYSTKSAAMKQGIAMILAGYKPKKPKKPKGTKKK